MIRKMMVLLLPLLFAWSISIATISCCHLPAPPDFVLREKQIMGTIARISVSGHIGARSIDEAFGVMEELDRILSVYKSDSQVSRLNQQGILRDSHRDLLDLIQKSREVERETGGAFNMTLAALTLRAYHFQDLNHLNSKSLPRPRSEDIRMALGQTGSQFVRVKGTEIKILKKGLGLDFGGIGKGYAIDKASAILAKDGLREGSLSLSGDIRCFGQCLIKIQDPQDPLSDSKFVAELRVRGPQVGISTSGGYGRFSGDPLFHHLIDPKTGKSVSNLSSLTLLGNETNTNLDAWATALAVMPLKRVREFLRAHPGLGYYIVFSDGRIDSNLDRSPWVVDFTFNKSRTN
jgi:thiamine biosynthesis lipoprotein